MKKLLAIVLSLLLAPAALAQTVMPDQRPHAGQTALTNKQNIFNQNQVFNGNITDNATIFANAFSGNGASITSLNATNITSGTIGCGILPAFFGDATTSGCSLTFDTVNSNVGTYNGITVNAKGLVTGAAFTNDSAALVATTANLNATYNNGTAGVGATLTNAGSQAAFSQDGIAVPLNGRVLVWKQTSQFQNGIYQLSNQGSGSTNWVLTRTTDFDGSTAGNVYQGATVPIVEGTTYAAYFFIETGLGPFTIGSTSIIFTGNQAASGGAVTSVSGDGSVYTNSGSTGSVVLTLGNQTANTFFAGPTSGSAATPGFRAIAFNDLPSFDREADAAFARTAQNGSMAVPDQEYINGSIARIFKNQIWTGTNNFNGAFTLGGISGSTQCLHVNSAGLVTGTGSDCGGGTGTVTSVGLSTNLGFMTVGSSPVTTTGTITLNATTGQTANQVVASPNGTTGVVSLRALVGADLPAPTASTLGGVESLAAVSHKWINTISTGGVPAATQPAFTDISGAATFAQQPSFDQEVDTAFARSAQYGSMPVPDQENVNGNIARVWKKQTWTALNNFTGGLQSGGANVLTANQSITLSGDTSGTGTTAITTTTSKVNGVSYGTSPSTNTVPVVTGTNATTYEAVPNAALANSSMTIGGQSISLGGTTTNQGNGGKIQLSTGTTTTNDCVKFDANGNTVDAGSACGGGGGSGTVTSVAVGTGLTASPSPITVSGTISEGNYTLAAKTAVFMNAGGL